MSRVQEILAEAEQIADPQEKISSLIRTAWDMRRSWPKDALEISLKARELSEHGH